MVCVYRFSLFGMTFKRACSWYENVFISFLFHNVLLFISCNYKTSPGSLYSM